MIILQQTKKPFEPKELPEDIPESLVKQLITDPQDSFRINIQITHKKYDARNKIAGKVEFEMRSQESSSTRANPVPGLNNFWLFQLKYGAACLRDEVTID